MDGHGDVVHEAYALIAEIRYLRPVFQVLLPVDPGAAQVNRAEDETLAFTYSYAWVRDCMKAACGEDSALTLLGGFEVKLRLLEPIFEAADVVDGSMDLANVHSRPYIVGPSDPLQWMTGSAATVFPDKLALKRVGRIKCGKLDEDEMQRELSTDAFLSMLHDKGDLRGAVNKALKKMLMQASGMKRESTGQGPAQQPKPKQQLRLSTAILQRRMPKKRLPRLMSQMMTYQQKRSAPQMDITNVSWSRRCMGMGWMASEGRVVYFQVDRMTFMEMALMETVPLQCFLMQCL